jgi:hypothetical protein
MSFLESDYDNAWSALRGNQVPIAYGDHDLLIGASRSETTVSELVVFPPDPDDTSRGGWSDPWYQPPGDEQDVGSGGADNTLEAFQAMSEAQAFAESKLGGASGEVASQLLSALKLLHFAANAYQWTVKGPFGETLSNLELASALKKMEFHLGPHDNDKVDAAYTKWREDGSGKVDIYFSIATEKYTQYTDAFGMIIGYYYTIFHELGHAMTDTFDMLKGGRNLAAAEVFANEYGQVLAEIAGLPYPSDEQLAQVGGTMPR